MHSVSETVHRYCTNVKWECFSIILLAWSAARLNALPLVDLGWVEVGRPDVAERPSLQGATTMLVWLRFLTSTKCYPCPCFWCVCFRNLLKHSYFRRSIQARHASHLVLWWVMPPAGGGCCQAWAPFTLERFTERDALGLGSIGTGSPMSFRILAHACKVSV